MSFPKMLEDAVLSLFLDEAKDAHDSLRTIVSNLDTASRSQDTRQKAFHVQGRIEHFLREVEELLRDNKRARVVILHHLVGRCHLLNGNYLGAACWLTSSLDDICRLHGNAGRPNEDVRDRIIAARSQLGGTYPLSGGLRYDFPLTWWAASALEMRGRAFSSIGTPEERMIALEDYETAIELLGTMRPTAEPPQPHVVRLEVETLLNAAHTYLHAGLHWSTSPKETIRLLQRSAQHYEDFLKYYSFIQQQIREDETFRESLQREGITSGWDLNSVKRSWKYHVAEAFQHISHSSRDNRDQIASQLWEVFVVRVSTATQDTLDDDLIAFMEESLVNAESAVFRERLKCLFLAKRDRKDDFGWLIPLVWDVLKRRTGLLDDMIWLRHQVQEGPDCMGVDVLRVFLDGELRALARDLGATTGDLLRVLLEDVGKVIEKGDTNDPAIKRIVGILVAYEGWILSVEPGLEAELRKMTRSLATSLDSR